MNEKKLETTPQQRKLPEWMSGQNETSPAIEGKVCGSPNYSFKWEIWCKFDSKISQSSFVNFRSPFKLELLLCD